MGRNMMPAINKNGNAKVNPNNLNINLSPPNINLKINEKAKAPTCLLYTSPSPRDV